MSPKTPGIQIIRKEEEEKPTNMEAFLVGFFLLGLVLGPLGIAASILLKLWSKLGVTDTTGIYVGLGVGLCTAFLLSIVFMKYATK